MELISTGYKASKDIEILGIPKSIGQAKYVGEILESLTPKELQSAALVLGEESLLLPILNSIPPGVPAVNITMGYPLKYSPFSYLFEKLLEFYKAEESKFYYKDVISVLSNPVIQRITEDRCKDVISTIKKENILYLDQSQISGLFNDPAPDIVNYIFPKTKPGPPEAIQKMESIIEELKRGLDEADDALNLEFLSKYHQITEQLKELVLSYPHIKSISSLLHFYRELSSQQTLDFQGNSFEGLQLMGMLESRVLDFDTVILTSVDEGILPAGKSNNSFIPYELKKTFGLPTYKEKDAVYTYHFYHLLQRAKKIFLLHNTDTESQMGGEKSRFLIQMELEKQPLHQVTTKIITPEVKKVSSQLQEVQKTPAILERIKELASNGFSPSALTTYIRNPLDFYLQYILKIRDKDEVEETVAYNTLGTVVHKTLETFYKPLKNQVLTEKNIQEFRKRATAEVKHQFELEYSKVPLTKGKNLLIFEVARRYVTNFLKLESKFLLEGKRIEIKEIEANLTSQLSIPELDFPVKIRGNVDRVDLYDDVLRIIDYKTGKVTQPQLEICEWDELTTNYDKYSKPFQVLMYATMLLENNRATGTVEAGVISFKNLKEGFLKFGEKESSRARKKNCSIEAETLENFKVQLKNLILEICDPKIPFLEKEIKKAHGNY
ncbi:PD-(D/E)XK nuclease family protein [Antarcticibacterium sp. 1MA-6-2]|uniref:PD-(D/E)XK nuclease family protein n=1 Tax=Antarcticibacterium sp. 1MA-6-2 TaxID=2908210 RepID=UPI001F33FA40|nr:PD-(D/E)XK nuclease family protein [Antarcticibacterium sp. 1MA-6-2]UJH90041.1 PD-(D/E)XK nuclease family protein [Antarcticibacterium sp. 1MA-6-2]